MWNGVASNSRRTLMGALLMAQFTVASGWTLMGWRVHAMRCSLMVVMAGAAPGTSALGIAVSTVASGFGAGQTFREYATDGVCQEET